jgi:alkylhydroperoxidase/carboxymuconolactone decarboxylase family protein YurZ
VLLGVLQPRATSRAAFKSADDVAAYCGVPVAVECHRIAKRVFAEFDGDG